MDDTTKKIAQALAVGAVKKGLIAIGTAAAAHGLTTGIPTELYAGVAVAIVSAGWSFWNDYGKAIVLSQLEVLKAKSLAQAQAMRHADVPAVTAAQIADQSPKLTPASVIKTVAKMPVACLVIGVLLLGLSAGDVRAQGIKVRLPDPLKLAQPVAKPAAVATAAPTGLAKLMADLAALQTKVVTDVVADMTAADADAATLTNPNDPTSFRDAISHACYPAAIKFLTELPVSTAPTGTLVAVQLFQKKRDFVMQIQAGLPTYLKLGCSPLLGDEAAVFTKLMGLVGVNVALNALVPGAGALGALTF